MKNNEEWSDGPWVARRGQPSEIQTLDGRKVAEAGGNRWKANARLITVAPELVEAVRRCRADLAGYVDHPGDFSAAYIEAHQVAISVLDEHFQPLLDRARGVDQGS